MKRSFAVLGLVALFVVVSSPAFAVTAFDQNITPTVIFGSGVTDGAWTTEQVGGLEIGVRAKLRYDATCQPQNVFNSNGDGTYTFPIGSAPCAPGAGKFRWSFEWAVNTDWDDITNPTGLKVDAYTYELGLDTNATQATTFCTFDPIIPGPADHAFGDNLTGIGAGDTNPVNYATNISTLNVVQQSWRYDFFDAGSAVDPCGYTFDPDIDGTYDVYLRVIDASGSEVARSTMAVDVGNGGPQPLPASRRAGLIALFIGLGLMLAFGVTRFRTV